VISPGEERNEKHHLDAVHAGKKALGCEVSPVALVHAAARYATLARSTGAQHWRNRIA
jgi:hypothetical protein